jgi:hypothetical protein
MEGFVMAALMMRRCMLYDVHIWPEVVEVVYVGRISTHPGKPTYHPASDTVAAFIPRRDIERFVGEESVRADHHV